MIIKKMTSRERYNRNTTTSASGSRSEPRRFRKTVSLSDINNNQEKVYQSQHSLDIFQLSDKFITPSSSARPSRPSSSHTALRRSNGPDAAISTLPKRPNTAISYRSRNKYKTNIGSRYRQNFNVAVSATDDAVSASRTLLTYEDTDNDSETNSVKNGQKSFKKYGKGENKESRTRGNNSDETLTLFIGKQNTKGNHSQTTESKILRTFPYLESAHLSPAERLPSTNDYNNNDKWLRQRKDSISECLSSSEADEEDLQDETHQLYADTSQTENQIQGRTRQYRTSHKLINATLPADKYERSETEQQDDTTKLTYNYMVNHESSSPSQHKHVRPLSRQEQFEQEKRLLVGNLRSILRGRLKFRRKAGITTDAVFQKQMESGFFTAEVLYHHWADDLLGMRKKWNSETYISSGSPESQEESIEPVNTPSRSRGRRMAFSNERESRLGPLSFANLRTFINIEDNKEDDDDDISDEDLAVATIIADSGHSSGRPTDIVTNGRVGKYNRNETAKPMWIQMQGVEEETKRERRIRLRKLFITTGRQVMQIIRVMLCMIRSSKEFTVANFMSQLHFFNAMACEGAPSSFRKEHFSRSFSKSNIPAKLQGITRKPPFERTPDEILRIYATMKNMKSFERFSHRMRMEISKATTYSRCEKGRVILRQGHIGHNFYFIYSGSVFVQIDIEDEKTGVLTPGTTLVIEKGACFGELALLGPGGKRTASIICRETTELFEIEKETFLDVCPDIFESELAEKKEAAMKHEFFQQWPKDKLERLCFESRIEEIMHGRVVDANTADTDSLYFILKGKVTIMKSFDITSNSRLAYDLSKYPTKGHKLPHTTHDNRCFMKIAELNEGEHTELTALRTGDLSQDPGVILVSNGVRLMRMSKKKLERFAPRGLVERFRRQYKPTLEVPSDTDLFLKYHSDVSWQMFRSKICTTLHKEIKGQ